VPQHVRVVMVPQELIVIRPEFRDHYYFVVRDEIVIVDRGHRIVAIIPVDERMGASDHSGPGAVAAVDLSPEEIRQVQLVLIQKGYDIGEADGVFGPRTRQALIVFQQREGLQVTGQIDSRTVAALGVNVRVQGGATTGQSGPGSQQPGMNPPNRNAPATGQNGSNMQQQPGSNTQGSTNMQQPNRNQGSSSMQQPGSNTTGQSNQGQANQGSSNMQPGSTTTGQGNQMNSGSNRGPNPGAGPSANRPAEGQR
jgi:peptidoglycan hydrolase-like protein with peptidoglycan-binding domain